ncbi:hypothetical protein [Rhizobium leguminosarum]|uniref:hypothetical protein n=1 Tax=Rhizobium leguminosarum TaxID=384 RepID=UPI00103051C7|nr:hypothetical protein [Rhizobium leguminosarum]TBF73041.1 hypothetical protein ELG84_09310 [Rhizobium leguminosarum]TBG16076.1 hypothetical protein ELG80_09485 [Rhizobium leguminosarum]
MDYDTRFAKRIFPARAKTIDSLAARDDNFRELCADFSIADELRRKWETSSAAERNERHAECLELVETLRNETEAALESASMIVIKLLPRR